MRWLRSTTGKRKTRPMQELLPFTMHSSWMEHICASLPGLTDSRGDDFTGDSPWLDLVLTGKFIIPTTSDPVFWSERFVPGCESCQPGVGQCAKLSWVRIEQGRERDVLARLIFFSSLAAYFNLGEWIQGCSCNNKTARNPGRLLPSYQAEDALWNQIYSQISKMRKHYFLFHR